VPGHGLRTVEAEPVKVELANVLRVVLDIGHGSSGVMNLDGAIVAWRGGERCLRREQDRRAGCGQRQAGQSGKFGTLL
jgi:hypothetical protein